MSEPTVNPFEAAARENGWTPEMGGALDTAPTVEDTEDPFVAAAKANGWTGEQTPSKPKFVRPKDTIDQDPNYTKEELANPLTTTIKSLVPDVLKSMASGAYGAIQDTVVAPAALAGVPGAESAFEGLEYMKEYIKPKSKTGNIGTETIASFTESVGATYLGGRMLGGKGKASTIGRGIFSKGVGFGATNYLNFMLDVETWGKNQGLNSDQLATLKKELKPYGAASGIAESAGEVSSDLLTARLFKLIGKGSETVVGEPVKNSVRDFVVKRLGLSTVGEVSGEELTTISQYFANKHANEAAMKRFKETPGSKRPVPLPQEDLLKQVKSTAGQTVLQSLLTAGLAEKLRTSGKKVEVANKIVEATNEKKKVEKEAINKQKGPKTRHKGKAEAVDPTVLAAAKEVIKKEIEVEEFKEKELNDEEKSIVQEAQDAGDVTSTIETLPDKQGKEKSEEAGEVKTEVEEEDVEAEAPLTEEGEVDWDKIAEDANKTTEQTKESELKISSQLAIEESKSDKTPITFIGMQETGTSKPAIALFNNLETKSTVTFDEKKHTITNSKEYEDALAKESKKEVPIQPVVPGIATIEKTDMEKAIEEALSGEVTTESVLETKQTKRQQLIAKAKEKKAAVMKEKKTLKPVKPATDTIEELKEAMYETEAEAKAALEKLGEFGVGYSIGGNSNVGFMLKSSDESTIIDLDSKVVQADPLFMTPEQISAIPRDTSNIMSATQTMLADINTFYHTSSGDIVGIAKQLVNMLDYVENNSRVLIKEQFKGDITAYNAWVDQLNRMAYFTAQVQKAKGPGTTLDFMGFQQIYNKLIELYNRWKAKRAFHKMKEIQYGVDGGHNITVANEIPNDVSFIATIFHSGSLPTTAYFPDDARSAVNDIIQSELWFKYNTEKESELIDRIKDKLTDDQVIEVTKLGYHIEEFSRVVRKKLSLDKSIDPKDTDAVIKAQIEDYLDTIEIKDPKVVSAYKDIRQAFDAWRQRYKEHLLDEERASMGDDFVAAIDEFSHGKPIAQAMKDNGIIKATDKKNFLTRLGRYYNTINEISEWGDEDYVTHMMIGDIRVTETVQYVDKNGKTKTRQEIIATGRNVKDAIEKARVYAKEQYANNLSVGKITLDDKFIYDGEVKTLLSRRQYHAFRNKLRRAMASAVKDIDNGTDLTKKLLTATGGVVGMKPAKIYSPAVQDSKHILPGENDIFVALHAYSRVMWKKVSYDPVISEIKRLEGDWEKNVKEHVNGVLNRSKGKYSVIDRLMDALLRWVGIETSRSFTRGVVNPTIKLVVNSKLGYRPTAALLNSVDGFAKVSIQFRNEYVMKAVRWAKSEEGKAIIEKNGWALGQRFEDVGGHLKTQQKVFGKRLTGWQTILTPTGLFNKPELGIREHNFATAFLFYRDQKLSELNTQGKYDNDIDKINEEAVDFAERSARISVWRLQGSNTMAERSMILANPIGRMFGVFMPYFIRNAEFITANAKSTGFWAKWIPYTLMMSGPRGVLTMFRSIPFLGFIVAAASGVPDFWERIEKELMLRAPSWNGGVGSLIGLDMVGAATAQFPNNSSTLGTMIDIYKGIIEPILDRDPNKWYKTKEGVKNVVIFAKNWGDILDAHFDQDGWVKDGNGNLKYNILTDWERLVIASGANPQRRSLQRMTNMLITKAEKHEIEKAQEIVSLFKNQLQGYYGKEADMDLVIDKVTNTAMNAMMEYHVKPQTLIQAAKGLRLSPGLKQIMNSKLINRLETFEQQMEVDKQYPGSVMP